MSILGIDFGLKRIGLALARTELVEPLTVLVVSGRAQALTPLSPVFQEIARLCQKYRVEKVVVGLPEGKIAAHAKKFAADLSKLTALPVVLFDETLTSQDAIAKMVSAGKARKDRKEKKDAVAAAIILQNYLN